MLKKCREMIPLKILLVVVVVLAIIVGTNSKIRSGVVDSLSAIYASVLVNLANTDRATKNISELKVNSLLQVAAQMKADDMAAKGYFAHNTPEGFTPWYWLDRAGYKYKYAGENLAVNFVESADVHRAWSASPTHWLNIINPKYTEIGIATSTGMYKGMQAVFVVQMFGSPR